ncbi:MAG: hypothetical protein M0R80_08495 [Proteobacteria bacterium]|jgi:hypothetical protein|nr:hypothetical protein [Pseudomonadota bacterium]
METWSFETALQETLNEKYGIVKIISVRSLGDIPLSERYNHNTIVDIAPDDLFEVIPDEK